MIAAFITVGIFLIRALSRYNQAMSEKKVQHQEISVVLKQHREECKMTQEFVAESIGISRQAVSKWETGASDQKHFQSAYTCKIVQHYGRRTIT